MHSLAQRVLFHIRRQELLKAGDRVGVAVSGGIDSVALLRLLLELRGELGIVLSVVHFNHRLRGAESDADEQFVADLGRAHDLEFLSDCGDVAEYASQESVSVEAAARELRYGFFRNLLAEAFSGAKAPYLQPAADRSAQSAAPTKSDPQGLKPASKETRGRGPKGPLFHDSSNGTAESRALSNQNQQKLDKIVTGHTLDDQAETVLMRLIRGTGLTGLGGIHPRIAVEDDDGEICGEIVRPLLFIRRRELEAYLNEIGQTWREDSTNADTSLTRNRVRKLLVPLLEKEFNPAVAENLAELAEIARGEEDYWENEVAGWMGTVVHWSEPEWVRRLSAAGLVQIQASQEDENKEGRLSPIATQNARRSAVAPSDPSRDKMRLAQDDNTSFLLQEIDNAPWLVANGSVSRTWFLSEPVAVQRRLVKAIGDQAGIPLEFKHVEDILHFAAQGGRSGKELSLPLGWKVTRHQDELRFETPDLREPAQSRDYDYSLSVPGRTEVCEGGFAIEVQRIRADAVAGYNPDELLAAGSLPGPLRVRNWRAGDRFWPAHIKSPKKIKELLQERRVARPERRLWPVVVSGDEIVWVRGFQTPASHQPQPGGDALLLSEKRFDRKTQT